MPNKSFIDTKQTNQQENISLGNPPTGTYFPEETSQIHNTGYIIKNVRTRDDVLVADFYGNNDNKPYYTDKVVKFGKCNKCGLEFRFYIPKSNDLWCHKCWVSHFHDK